MRLEGNGNGSAGRDAGQSKIRRMPTTPTPDVRDAYRELKSRIQTRLISELENEDLGDRAGVEEKIRELFDTLLAQENIILSRVERGRMFDQIVSEILGFGPLILSLKTRPLVRSWSTALTASTWSGRGRSSSLG